MQLNVHKFLTVCTHLAFESSRIIKNIHETAGLKTFLKGVNDPVTEADYKVQSFIVKGLKQYWPQLTIVGEEDKDYEGRIDYDFNQLEHNIFDRTAFSIGKEIQSSRSIDISKMTVWIDPLDGTLSYTEGHLDEVTTMIGVSYQGRARLGVIGSHFLKKLVNNRIEYEYNPRVFVGDTFESRAYKIDSNFEVSCILPRKHKQRRLCISRSRMTPESLKRMQFISNNISRVGGSGKKALEVIEDKSDSFIYLGQGIGSWDVCAPEALIRSINGIETKANGDAIDYRVIGKQLLQGGTVLSIDEEIHRYVLQRIRTFKS